MENTPRYVVRTYSHTFRSVRFPHKVVDTKYAIEIDEYASKRAANMHARELNKEWTARESAAFNGIVDAIVADLRAKDGGR